jgi:hypothetical protein
MGDGGDAHVKIRGERVEDLVGAHVGVGVNDTLATALHAVGCEVEDGGTGECEGQLRTGALVQCWLYWTWGEILEADRLRRAIERLTLLLSPERPPHRACWAEEQATPAQAMAGQLAIDGCSAPNLIKNT